MLIFYQIQVLVGIPSWIKRTIVQVDDSDNRFLYDEVTSILTGPAGEYKIDSSMVGEKIKFSYFHSTPTDKPTLEIYLIDKWEK